jgi:hypothetical protein
MKSQIKDIVIGIFAIIGFTAIVMGFNNPQEPQQVTYATPESHVWEMHVVDGGEYSGRAFAINKATGEVRKYNRKYPTFKGISDRDEARSYLVTKNIEDIQN